MAKTTANKARTVSDQQVLVAVRTLYGSDPMPRGGNRRVAAKLGVSNTRVSVALRRAGVDVRLGAHLRTLVALQARSERQSTPTEQRVIDAVVRHQGDRARAAAEIGVSRQFVYRVISAAM